MTRRYAVIGNPIRHSKSPLIHRSFARASGIDLEYTTIECPDRGFVGAVAAFRREGGRGLNVTAPFKQQAFALADRTTDRARVAGAVNTLLFESTLVLGDNFDGIGLLRDLRANLECPVAGRRVLLLGAGGAVRGVLQPLLEQAPADLVIANRTVARAQEILTGVPAGSRVRGGGYDEIGPEAFDLVINATSASVRGELPPLSSSVFKAHGLAYDLAYGVGLTPFLERARSAGVRRLADGVGMLVEQAAESFEWWTGIRPDTRGMIRSLTVPLV